MRSGTRRDICAREGGAGLRTLLDLDAEAAERGRKALVVTDQQTQLDRLAVVESRLHGAPGGVRQRAPGEQLVAGGEQRPLPRP